MRKSVLLLVASFIMGCKAHAQSWDYVGRLHIPEVSAPFHEYGSLYWGEGVEDKNNASFAAIQAMFTIGTGQADIRALTYEDGSPIIEKNKLYCSISTRTGGGGASILELDLGTSQWKLVGIMLGNIDGVYWHTAAAHIMYNRETGIWQVTVSGHRADHHLYVSHSFSDLRYGVNRLSFRPLDYENKTHGDEDPEIFYWDKTGKWYLVYSKESHSIEVQESDSPDADFKHAANNGTSATGITTTSIGGQLYCISGAFQKENGENNYPIYTFPH